MVREQEFVCENCGNSNPKMIGYLNGKPYCRKCIKFKGNEAENYYQPVKTANYKLAYELSKDQLRLSNQLVTNYKKGINTLVHAICGSGKTEIVLEVIRYAIECGEKVGFAVPRRDVAIELFDRFTSIFKRNKIALVYGGNTNNLTGDLICLTTHQLYRYKNYFDLLILDEVDAFPFKNNEVLHAFFNKSVKRAYIMLSATPDKELLSKFKQEGMDIVELFVRFHNHPLPVPKLIRAGVIKEYFVLFSILNRFRKDGKQCFIFCPTIDKCEKTYRILRLFFNKGNYVHSMRKQRMEVIKSFREKKYQYLVTTSVLERGVTVKDLQVIVFQADHSVYDRYSLVQIAGRVGRKKDAPEGEVVFIAKDIDGEVIAAKNDIVAANKNLQGLF